MILQFYTVISIQLSILHAEMSCIPQLLGLFRNIVQLNIYIVWINTSHTQMFLKYWS